MRLLTPPTIRRFRHGSLTFILRSCPAFPGLNAQKQALDYGVKITGCTVHYVIEEMDAGPIFTQAAVPVLPGDTENDLSKRILVEEHRFYVETLP